MNERNRRKVAFQWERADRAVREATRRAVEQHRRLGLPVAVEQEGQLVWLDPESLETPPSAGPGGLLTLPRHRTADPQVAQRWLEGNCPTLFSMMKGKPERVVPPGLLHYLSPRTRGDEGEGGLDVTGTGYLRFAEEALEIIKNLAGPEELKKLGKRLASVGKEDELVQLLCETSVCAALARLAEPGSLVLEPQTLKGRRCDVKLRLGQTELWGEVKRYSDTWPSNPDREQPARALSVQGHREAPEGARPARSRAEALRSKLDGKPGEAKGVPDQLPEGTLNVLFLFEDAWSPLPHVRAAFLGDEFYFRDPDPEEEAPAPDGLFARDRWTKISACCWVTARAATATNQRIWLNPRAECPVPAEVAARLENL